MRDKNPDLPILLVDDEEQACNYYTTALETSLLNNVIHCTDSRQVMPLLEKSQVKVVVLDIIMPHISGLELLAQIVHSCPHVPVIMLTAVNEIETAVRCMQSGAFDYMLKPVEKSRFVSGIKRAIEVRELKEENLALKESFFSDKLEHEEAFSEIITNNSKMFSIFKYIESVANSPRPILISGETGVGKELFARVIHKISKRQGQLISVNVAGLDDNVFSDTLFGHKKGAFTGADSSRSGLIVQAGDGTLFLDEIGDLDEASQVKLLRLLQEGEYYPLGSDIKKMTDARIVAVTNHNLEASMKEGKFRRDLFYRLSSHHIVIPPLRKRLDDLPVLVEHFIAEAAKSLKKEAPALTENLIRLLSAYHFPGNVRELQGMVYDAVSLYEGGKLSLESFKDAVSNSEGLSDGKPAIKSGPGRISPHSDNLNLPETFGERFPPLREVEELLIRAAMKRAGGKQFIAANLLGISRPTLNKRLKQLEAEE
ncbi:MAG: sigma-54 dependent transcriptional regulator [Deltaproteobacteria bacterium]|nr:sigma-54 dependent transcriptional regulator [Deltaproteobacteria bacterium]